jgi:hypothetical protein
MKMHWKITFFANEFEDLKSLVELAQDDLNLQVGPITPIGKKRKSSVAHRSAVGGETAGMRVLKFFQENVNGSGISYRALAMSMPGENPNTISGRISDLKSRGLLVQYPDSNWGLTEKGKAANLDNFRAKR